MISETSLNSLHDKWFDDFRTRNKRSQGSNLRAENVIAKSQRMRFNSGMPFPVYIDHGVGAHAYDIDGNRLLDCNAGWNASFVGRGNPAVVAAVSEAMERLGAPGGAMHPSPIRDEFAEMLCSRVPGAERVLFAPSGSEANTYALRLARSFTGRRKIIRMSGGFHGQHDALLGEQSSKVGTLESSRQDVTEVPFNDLHAATEMIEKLGNEVAAVIVEPMMTIPGAVHQRGNYLAELRAVAKRSGVLLIFDEVITGGRFAVGGAAEFYAVEPPDLTVMGKMLGGGLPVATVIGRAEVVESPISASNTHAQNPVAIAAAVETMRICDSSVFARTNEYGETLRSALRSICKELAIPVQVTGDGPCFGVHFSNEEILDYATAEKADHRLWSLMCLGLSNSGIGVSSRTMGPTSVWNDEDLSFAISAFSDVLGDISDVY